MTDQQIIIMGFMGTGKTTVAFELGRELNCRAMDLDDLITEREGRSPKEIIEQDGEEAFRRIETKLLREALQEKSARILAVGGGAWTVVENRKLIVDEGALTVWLDAPFELCWKRIEAGNEGRPLAPSRDVAQTLYDQRHPIYALSDVRVPVSENETAREIATKITRGLSESE
ncbi:MAG TPA: shikimate kinase [Pyrinomonadaceae bacterium]|jgi:shikimate kinase